MSATMSKDEISAAEFALGLIRGEQRRAVEKQLASDAALRSRVERWEMNFATLADAEAVAPPDDMLERVLERIDAEARLLPGTVTVRAEEAVWQELSPGVTFRVLNDDAATMRRSMLIRMLPGAIYESHHHDEDEECLVIEGDLRFGDLGLKAGDFHLARKGMTHPPAATVNGCLLYVTAALH